MLPYCVEPIPKYIPTIQQEIQTDSIFNFSYPCLFEDENEYFLFKLGRKNCKVKNKELLMILIKKDLGIKNDILLVLEMVLNYFGENQKTSIEPFYDDEETTSGDIFINVTLKNDSANNFLKFKKVNDWFIENIYKHRQHLNINLDFE